MISAGVEDLVLLRLEGERAIDVRRFRSGQWAELPVEEKSASRQFKKLVEEFPASWIAWCDRFLEPFLSPPEQWPAIVAHKLEVLHAGGLHGCQALAPSIGLVDWASPFILPPPKRARFPMWMASPWAGIGHASLFTRLGLDPSLPSFTVTLWDCIGRGMKSGVCPYSEPRLIRVEPPAGLTQFHKRLLNSREVATLVNRVYGGKWVVFWLVGSALSGRGLPLGSAIRALIEPTRIAVDECGLHTLQPEVVNAAASRPTVDVIIPTLSRENYLLQTLDDLAAQEFLPARVIIIEQQPGDSSMGLATRLAARTWPFELIHRRVSWAGVCRARNLALREVSGEWVLMLDDDVRPPKGWLGYLVSIAQAYCVGAVTSATYLQGETAKLLPRTQLVSCWKGFASGASLVCKEAIDATGGFDERGEGGFGEDGEYGVRLRFQGCNVLYAPGDPILHLKAPSGGFRYVHPLPWNGAKVQPRPSPTVQYYMRKHASRSMKFGYAQFYFLKRLVACRWYKLPLEIPRIRAQWRSSLKWAERLAQQQTTSAGQREELSFGISTR